MEQRRKNRERIPWRVSFREIASGSLTELLVPYAPPGANLVQSCHWKSIKYLLSLSI